MRRRDFLRGSTALAGIAFQGGLRGILPTSLVAIDGLISYGQSWRVNFFNNFGIVDLNQLAVLAFKTTNPVFPLLPVSAGISIAGVINGVGQYAPSDVYTIGRCSVIAQQLWRIHSGATVPQQPIAEFCAAYPGSTWGWGGGAGLAPGATFTASIASNVMTVASVGTGQYVSDNSTLSGAGIPASTFVFSGGPPSGSGGVGTYQVGVGQTVSAPVAPVPFTTAGSSFKGWILLNLLEVSSVTSGTISIGETVVGSGAKANSVIIGQNSGTTGGVGEYVLQVGTPFTVGSETMTTTGTSWTNMRTVLSQMAPLFPAKSYASIKYTSVGWTQGTSTDGTLATKLTDLATMIQDFDALSYSVLAPFLDFYLGLPAAPSVDTTYGSTGQIAGYWGTYLFLRANAPGAGGPYSGRIWASAPSYPWIFDGSGIHTTGYGMIRWAELEGYARHLVRDLGVQWTPLWRSMTNPITRSGTTFIVPFDRPTGPDFTTAPMAWQSDPQDGIQVWPQYGWHVKRSGTEMPLVSDPIISGMSVILDIGTAALVGDEVSYCFYGPGGTVPPGIIPGVGGNLVMNGPASVMVPGKQLGMWAWPFAENVTT
jgi:hypothetical protein